MNSTLASVTLIAAAVAAVLYLSTLGIKAFRRFLTVADVLLGNEEQNLPSLDKRLVWIEHELKPNSGLSLRDSVDRIEKALEDHLTNR
jgi:hypothetical protein